MVKHQYHLTLLYGSAPARDTVDLIMLTVDYAIHKAKRSLQFDFRAASANRVQNFLDSSNPHFVQLMQILQVDRRTFQIHANISGGYMHVIVEQFDPITKHYNKWRFDIASPPIPLSDTRSLNNITW